jgi:hypothetical protein
VKPISKLDKLLAVTKVQKKKFSRHEVAKKRLIASHRVPKAVVHTEWSWDQGT